VAKWTKVAHDNEVYLIENRNLLKLYEIKKRIVRVLEGGPNSHIDADTAQDIAGALGVIISETEEYPYLGDINKL